jgi:hypothetical protein
LWVFQGLERARAKNPANAAGNAGRHLRFISGRSVRSRTFPEKEIDINK